MIPLNILSTTPVQAQFIETVNRRTTPLIDFERGGIALLDGSQGMNIQEWKAEVIGNDVFVSAPNTPQTLVFSTPGITEISLAFDYSMNPTFAYVDGTGAHLRWWDTSANGIVTTEFPDILNPRITLDEKRDVFAADADIIMAYTRSNGLYYRQQRDRYLTEYLLKADVNATLVSVGMNKVNRLQFRMIPT